MDLSPFPHMNGKINIQINKIRRSICLQRFSQVPNIIKKNLDEICGKRFSKRPNCTSCDRRIIHFLNYYLTCSTVCMWHEKSVTNIKNTKKLLVKLNNTKIYRILKRGCDIENITHAYF